MSFMLALPKISLHGAGAIGDMVNLVANKQWGKSTDRYRWATG
ncbi:alcohol dehydrogenase [Escherichia fergusonii]|nr:alcohol dehydrogenase [Escherichia fergusonii]